MAPSRGKGKAPIRRAAASSTSGGGRTTRSRAADNDIPAVYQSMLDEANAAEDTTDRPVKRRKVAGRQATPEGHQNVHTTTPASRSTAATARADGLSSAPREPASRVQTIEESSEDDVSEFEFEDVDIDGAPADDAEPADGIEDLTISLQPESSVRRATQQRRKPATFAEKSHRLQVHKMHVLCLLSHCMYINGRCNNTVAQKRLRPLLTSKTVSYLNPRSDYTQFQRNRSFMDGLQMALDAFTSEYKVTTGGMTKPQWEVEGESGRKHDYPLPVDKADFISAAKDLEGTQDLGNQLFCALLRSVGVEARMVCSLQVFPFTSVPKQSTPKKPIKTRMLAIAGGSVLPTSSGGTEDTAVRGSKSIGSVPSARRRLGQPTFETEASFTSPPKTKSKPVPKLSFPVFWVEAFNAAQQAWIAIDPCVTNTVNKPSQFEPPASYELNSLTYAIAFEIDSVARDVTKRYAKAYNAKTRRHRVESSSDGAKWVKKVMRFFRRRGGLLDRDQVEDAALAQKEAKEGMPGNVQDFKDHPYYALERHLKRHEVIHPKRQVGKVNAGTAAKPRVEPVFRRQDVFVCKSADKWYRLGRKIKEAEQPLKHIPARAKRQLSVEDENDNGPAALTALYAPYQTQQYIPPAVQRGRVPKNVYGNLDIYVPSMVPPGGVHIRHDLAQRAAKTLRIDYADAVTGFKFQGRHGTAIMEGVVVAQQYSDAVHAVIEGIVYDISEEESKARSLVALRLWKRFLTGLRITERVNTYAEKTTKEAETDTAIPDVGTVPSTGLFPGGLDPHPLPTAGQYSVRELTARSRQAKRQKRKKEDDTEDEEYEAEAEDEEGEPQYDAEGEGGGFFPEAHVQTTNLVGGFEPIAYDYDDGGGGFVHDSRSRRGGLSVDEDGGGFVTEDGGGGFVVEDEQNDDLFEDNHSSVVMPTAVSSDDVPPKATELTTPTPEKPLSTDGNHHQTKQIPEEPGAGDAMMDSDYLPVQSGGEPDPAAEEHTTLDDGEDESDKASILSHDPEDDDAEPDWLESD